MNNNTQNINLCDHHLKQALVGVCPLCLNEKLLPLEAIQARHRHRKEGGRNIVGLPKMISLRSFLKHLQRRRRRSVSEHGSQSTSTSLDGSFISIKFEENGAAIRGKNKMASEDHLGLTEEETGWTPSGSNNSVMDLPEVDRTLLRWHKRIGHMLQLVKWKRGVNQQCNINVDGVKLRTKGWVRTLTKKENKTAHSQKSPK